MRSSLAPPTGIDAVRRTELVTLSWKDFTKDCASSNTGSTRHAWGFGEAVVGGKEGVGCGKYVKMEKMKNTRNVF